MKLPLSAILIITFALAGHAQQQEKVNWYSFEKAVELNRKNPRKILVDVYTDWCGWCKKMKKQTFNHPKIAKYINENFYAVRFNAETNKKVEFKGHTFTKNQQKKNRPHDLAIALLNGKMSYPSVVYLDGKNQPITVVPGYHGPKDYEAVLKYFARDIYKNKSYKEFRKEFQNTLIQ